MGEARAAGAIEVWLSVLPNQTSGTINKFVVPRKASVRTRQTKNIFFGYNKWDEADHARCTQTTPSLMQNCIGRMLRGISRIISSLQKL